VKKQLNVLVVVVAVVAMSFSVALVGAQDDRELEPVTWEETGLTIGVPSEWEGEVVTDESTLTILSGPETPDFEGEGLLVFYFPPEQVTALATLAEGDTDYDVAAAIVSQILQGLEADGESTAAELEVLETEIGDWPFYNTPGEDNFQLYTVVIADDAAFLVSYATSEMEAGEETEALFLQIINSMSVEGTDIQGTTAGAEADGETDGDGTGLGDLGGFGDGDADEDKDETDDTTDAEPTGDVDLIYGNMVEGEITESSTSIPYTFEGNAGDVVTISMTADEDSSLDTYLELLGPDGMLVSENDDGGEGLNSLIVGQPLPEDGVYTIQATRWGGTGTFVLTIESVELNQISIANNQTVTSEINDVTPAEFYAFDGSAGDQISVSMTSTNDFSGLDTLLILRDAEGNEIAENDDGGEGVNSLLEFTLPEDGTYVIVATRWGGEGEYELTLTIN